MADKNPDPRALVARSVNDPTAKGVGPPEARRTPLNKPAPASRTEAVQEALRQAIIEQRLRPGARLPEDAIGETFGTSRTIAREALGRLAVEGLVELKPNKGAFVANPSLEEGRDIFIVRRGLEGIVTGLLAGKLQPAELKALDELVGKERAAAGVDEPESIRLAGEFHLVLVRMTGNALLIRYLTEVISRCSLILAMYGRPHSAACGADEHHDIIQALESGDAAAADRLMDTHLAAVASRAQLESKPERDIRDLLAPYAKLVREIQ